MPKHQIYVENGEVVGTTLPKKTVEVVYIDTPDNQKMMDLNTGKYIKIEDADYLPPKMIVHSDVS